jgi:hypothetical protein
MTQTRAVGGFLSVLTAVLLSIPGLVQAETAGGFAGRLDQAIRQVEAARDHGASLGDPSTFFPDSEEVAGPGGTMRVDHTSLRAEWMNVPPAGSARQAWLERLRYRLVAVRAEVTGAATDAVVAPPSVGWREKLTAILSRLEFRKEGAEADWRARLLQWLWEKLGFLFPASATQAVGSVLRWIIYALAGMALLAVLFVFARAALPLFLRDRRSSQTAAGSTPGPVETEEAFLALADARARGGDLRGAAQAIFRWMLLGLHRTGRLEYDAALTNREHLTRLKADAGVRLAFGELCRQFELVWYGFHPVAPGEFAAFQAECQRVAGGRA